MFFSVLVFNRVLVLVSVNGFFSGFYWFWFQFSSYREEIRKRRPVKCVHVFMIEHKILVTKAK